MTIHPSSPTAPDGTPTDTLVVFSHGKESGPQGNKIRALMRIAEAEGAQAISIDYREDPPGVPHDHDLPGEAERRVRQLLATPLPPARRLVLVGSSMGGHVSTAAASSLPVDGLFLLAPAFVLPGGTATLPTGRVPRIAIIHGWGDDIVPWQNSVQFAEEHRCALHLIDSDHRLEGAVPVLEHLFGAFLREMMQR